MSFDAQNTTERVSFPQSGEQYIPLPNKVIDGYVHAHALQTIHAAPEELSRLWSDVTFIPRWQEHVVSCTPISEGLSHWVMGNPDDPDGKRIEFDSQIVENEPGSKLAWKSITEGVEQSGSVSFSKHPAGRGSIVLLQQVMRVPGGKLGNAVAATAERSPAQTVIEDLRHFKQIAEAGEIPSVAGQPHGPRGISGSIKKWMYGETNPTPKGTTDAA